MGTLKKAVWAMTLLSATLLLCNNGTLEFLGLARASAQLAVDSTLRQVPDTVRDRRLDLEVADRRRQIQDHRIALGVSRRQLEGVVEELRTDERAAAERASALAAAIEALRKAKAEGRCVARFADTERPVSILRQQADALAIDEQQDQERLTARRAALQRLTSGIEQGEACVVRMTEELTRLEGEVALLRTRRSNAALESRTLDLVGALRSAFDPKANLVGSEAERMRVEIRELEVANDARRRALEGPASNGLTTDWRLAQRLASNERPIVGAADGR